MKTATTNTAYLVGMNARNLKCTVTHDQNEQITYLTGDDLRDRALASWVRDLMIRVRGAINILGLPGGFVVSFDHKPTINARPDLAIVAACLKAMGRDVDVSALYLGELSHASGRVVTTRGVLPILESVEGFGRAFVPRGNGIEAGANTNRIMCTTIADVHDLIDPSNTGFAPATLDQWESLDGYADPRCLPDRAIVQIKSAILTNRNVLIVGENAWNTAKIFHGLLPRLSGSEARAVACTHSIAGLLTDGKIPTVRPFRAPHYSIEERGLVGSFERLGEVSLAHHGTLVLDHVTQFKRVGLEWLKGPVRTNVVTCTRRDERVEWPAKCRIVATVYPDEQRFFTPERVAFLGDYVRVDV